jgi:pilus retraction protein PilT
VDFARSVQNVRIRINAFTTTRGLSLAIRLLPGAVPELDKLNLHPSLKEIAGLSSGLVLICGATGCGKSTTIAGLVEEINRNRAAHVITLEDPVEYRFISKKSFVEQRELGNHIPSFQQGLLDVLREDPDVIVVGELREPETMRLTLNAVESGHLVLATLHASNSEDALYRICNSFAPEAQDVVRHQLASTLAVLIVQKLIQFRGAGFRVPLLSILRGNAAVRTIVRENKMSQLEGIMQTGRNAGMFTREKYYSEYLETRESFTPPRDNFRPSPEASKEVIYTSPLTSPYAAGKPGGSSARSKKAAEAKSTWDSEGRYVIEDEAPIHELIAEMKNDGE